MIRSSEDQRSGFATACVLSIGIEYLSLRDYERHPEPFRNVGRNTALANLASYAVLLAAVWVHLRIFR